MACVLILPFGMGAGQILNTPINVVYRLGFYITFFLLGYFVFSSENMMEKLK